MEGFGRLLFPFYYVLSMIVLCPLHALRSYIAIEDVQASFEAGNLNEFDTFLIYRISYSAPSYYIFLVSFRITLETSYHLVAPS